MESNLSRFRGWAKRLAAATFGPQRTEITVQTDRVVIIHRRRSPRVWCEECGREVDVVSLPEAGVLTGTTQSMLSGTAAADGWHVCPGRDGEPRICLESVLKSS